jgi:uncharacterized membrane protein
MESRVLRRIERNMKIIKIIDKVERDLCSALDGDVYIPVRDELEKIDAPHSLGNRKEDFKNTIHNQLEKIKQEIEK